MGVFRATPTDNTETVADQEARKLDAQFNQQVAGQEAIMAQVNAIELKAVQDQAQIR